MSVKRRDKNDKESNWYYRFTYKGQDFCEGGFRTSAQAAEAERIKLNAEIAKKLHPEDYAGEMTFRQAGEWWLKNYTPTKRSMRVDRARMPLMIAYFDQKLMREIKPDEIATFLTKLTDLRDAATIIKRKYKITDHTRNHYLHLIRALYERLKKMRMYKGENPGEFVPMIQVPQARVRFIYPAEEKILTPAVAMEPGLLAYYRMGMGTGMRIGEMRGIRVEHLDTTLQHIFVPHPKNARSRYVPLNEPLMAFLSTLLPGKAPSDFLLPHWSYNMLREHFMAICAKVGIKNLRIHDWRHTFAYNALSQGTSLYKVSILLGHSSQKVTQDHYGHLAAKDLRDAIESIKPFLSCDRFATGDEIYRKVINEMIDKSDGIR